MPWKIIIIVMVVLGCLYTALFTINTTSIDGAVESITPSVFEVSIIVNSKEENIDALEIDKDIFEPTFLSALKDNMSFYQGSVSVWFYYFNVLTQSTCNEHSTCNGVQIKLKMNTFYMFGKERIYAFEVSEGGR
ncbi:MAG: hypothetical protein LBM99_04425 [Bacillales bacterium]|jgi:hypothetical protein|nr:hypothetical protein [Bacillales bacterium]